MNGWVKSLMVVFAGLVIGLGGILAATEAPYQPAVPNAPQVYGGGWGGGYYSSPGTVAGSAMQGMASLASAAGSYNLSTSAAAVNMTQAEKQAIQNYDSYVNTYFQMRSANQKYREAERGPRLSEAELNRLAKTAAPKPLSSRQLDPVEGAIAWPTLLQEDKFESQRALLDKAFAWRAHSGNFNLAQLEKVEDATNSMLKQLREIVADADPMEYTQAKNFVQSLAYEARKPTS